MEPNKTRVMHSDLFGEISRPIFQDIKNTRPSVAEEKAALALVLNKLVKAIPKSINSASVNYVRQWREANKSALKVLNSKSSSRVELQSAISNLERYFNE